RQTARAGYPDLSLSVQSQARKSLEAGLRGRSQYTSSRAFRVLKIELQQAVRYQADDESLPDGAQGDWVNQSRQSRAKFSGDFRYRVHQPVAILEFLQTFCTNRPKLPSRAFINAVLARRRRHQVDIVSIEFADRGHVEMFGQDFPIGSNCYRSAGWFRQVVGQLKDSPMRRFLGPARLRQR